MRLLDLRQQVGRRFSRKSFEVVDQMHLVVVAERVSDLRPTFLLRPCPAVERRLESCDARVELGPHANLPGEPAFKLTEADSNSLRKIADPHLTMSKQDLIRGRCNTITARPVDQYPQQEIVSDASALFERSAGAEALVQA